MQVEKRYYNHGIIEYKFKRTKDQFGFNYLYKSKDVHKIILSYKENVIESIEIPHFEKETYGMNKRAKFFKFDNDFISFYTVPRNLQKRLINIEETVNYKHKKANELGYHYIPYNTSRFMQLTDKLTSKSLKLKKVEYIDCKIIENELRSVRNRADYYDSY